jgi:hypothetical protein
MRESWRAAARARRAALGGWDTTADIVVDVVEGLGR